PKAALLERAQLGAHLRRLFGARHPAVNFDDVAEFTPERTSAGKLHRHSYVVIDVRQELKSRNLDRLHIGSRAALIMFIPAISAQVANEFLDDGFDFAEANPISISASNLRQSVSKRPANGNRLGMRFSSRNTGGVILPLRHHYAQEDHIRPIPIRLRFLFYVAIDQANGKILGKITGKGQKTQGRHDRLPTPQELYRPRGIPESLLGKFGIEHQDIH